MSNLAMMMGLGSGAGGVNVADVFSTTLYTGNATADTKITTGVDLNTNGGLLWTKKRSAAADHYLFDTKNAFDGALSGSTSKRLKSNDPAGEASELNALTSFDTDGFTISTNGAVNGSGSTYVSWSFVQSKGFFDVQNYSGTGSVQTLSHNLNADVGMIIIKQLSSGNADWSVYHRSLGGTKNMRLDDTRAVTTNIGYFADTDATSTEFTVGYLGDFNTSGNEYVAYLFAHNEDLIQCGSYTGTGANGNSIELGFKPQWIMIKRTNSTGNWIIVDEERGMTDSAYAWLYPNSSSGEDAGASSSGLPLAEATGFTVNGSSIWMNASGSTYIYMAIKAED